jgi:hypothetical protein
MTKRLLPTEVFALAQLAYSEGLRSDIRKNIVESLDGDARKIAEIIVCGHSVDATLTHIAVAAQLKDWAKSLRMRKLRKVV